MKRTGNVGGEGAALLEVLLALALFVAAAAVVTSALNSALASLERQRLSTQAINLATSLMAEIQLGIRPAAAEARRPMAKPYEEWSTEIRLEAAGNDSFNSANPNQIEVVVRHENPAWVQRLAQVIARPGEGPTNNPTGVLR